jgi:uncharacterized membrane protein
MQIPQESIHWRTMNAPIKSTLVGLLLLAWASPVAAADFFGLGSTLSPELGSSAVALSSDGRIAVGQSGRVPNQPMEGFRWTRERGLEGLGGAPNSSLGTSANDVALDGTVVGLSFLLEAVEWSPDNVLRVLPNLPPPDATGSMFSEANAISEDGQWIVGTSWDSAGQWSAVRWNAERQITRLPFTYGYDVSGDGSVAVGTLTDALGSHAVRWTETGGLQELGELPAGRDGSTASRVSADGKVVVGQVWSSVSYPRNEPFRWTADGGMVGLGLLPDFDGGGMVGLSGGGEVLVGGFYQLPITSHSMSAVIWTDKLGLFEASQYFESELGLADQLVGWRLSSATAVSRDGSVIVGLGINPQGHEEAWMVIVPEPMSDVLAVSGLALAGTFYLRQGALRRNRIGVKNPKHD